ncbi:NAD(P)H-binding protein [Paenibacillus sp. TRM 82003]|uniref:NAD(P)H-binding protein n=1 Tax=Kineococcus sp. TRM81007 TaxID=2925831 RepID=UPI001F579F8B|nr:NAD(P)H-binding protein [Kineococcus sp. TRM81007]MCI2238635.1 NAD(P)H-binding protein [Kineococcus sp. TRM81007]MCI3927297.1 NAD(P)H-binding protein [Paenibacillus sp. TRM 82003]
MTTFAVTAAGGRLGHLVVEALLERGVPAGDVVAVVRTPGKVADLAERGVRVRRGDYDEPDTLREALAGVDRLLLVSGDTPGQRVTQHANVVEAARAAGVQRLAYTSILRADTSGNPLAPDHRATEEALAASGIPTTVLRDGWYLENYTEALGQYLAAGEVVGSAHDGRVSAASRADYAAAAAAALLADDDGDRVHELGGPGFTLAELAATVSEVTGTPVAYRDLSTEEHVAHLRSVGLDEGTAGFVAALDASLAAGELHTDRDDLQRLIGRPATALADAVRAARA